MFRGYGSPLPSAGEGLGVRGLHDGHVDKLSSYQLGALCVWVVQ